MQRLEVSGAIGHIYIYMPLDVKRLITEQSNPELQYSQRMRGDGQVRSLSNVRRMEV
jgi:hypothetical protein